MTSSVDVVVSLDSSISTSDDDSEISPSSDPPCTDPPSTNSPSTNPHPISINPPFPDPLSALTPINNSPPSSPTTYPPFLPQLLQLQVPIRHHILPYLDPCDLSRLELVDRSCLRAIRAGGYWKDVVLDVLRSDSRESRVLEGYDEDVVNFVSSSCGGKNENSLLLSSSVDDDDDSDDAMFYRRLWSRIQRDLRLIDENVRRNRCCPSLLLLYHLGQQQKTEPIFRVDGSHRFVFSVADDAPEVVVTRIKRRSRRFIAKNQYPLNLNGDNVGKVTCIEVKEDFLFVGYTNGAVVVWNWKLGEHVNQLAHRLGILVLKARARRLMIGSRDRTASLWQINPRPLTAPVILATLHVSRGLIRALDFNETVAVVVSDNTVGVWSLETEACLRTLQGNTVTCVTLNENLLVAGYIDRTVKLWDVFTGKCLKALEECAAEVTCLVSDWKRTMFTGDRKGNVRVWDLNKITDIETTVVSSVITNLKFKGSQVHGLSYDGVTMFVVLKQRDAVNHRQIAVHMLDFAPPTNANGRKALGEKCSIS